MAGVDISGLRRDGYQILRGVLSPGVVSSVQAFLQESLAQAFAAMAPWDIRADDPDNSRKVAAVLADARPGDLPEAVQSIMLGHFPLATRLSERLWAIPRDAGLRAVLDAAYGGRPIFMHMPPTARFILPNNFGAAVPPHQDATYNQHLADFYTVWVPLVEIDDLCGGMAVFEGSQDEPELLDDRKSEQWLAAVATTGFPRRACRPLSPGDLIIFNKQLNHLQQAADSRLPAQRVGAHAAEHRHEVLSGLGRLAQACARSAAMARPRTRRKPGAGADVTRGSSLT